MSLLVVDASAILGLALAGEPNEYSDAVLTEVVTRETAAPAIFWFELRNVLVTSERRGRISASGTAAFLASVAELGIRIEPVPPESGVLEMARSHRLTVYDAAYLELAKRSRASLATLDARLAAAAEASGVPVFSV